MKNAAGLWYPFRLTEAVRFGLEVHYHLHTSYFIEAELMLRKQVPLSREQYKWFGIRNRGSCGIVIRLDVRFVNSSS